MNSSQFSIYLVNTQWIIKVESTFFNLSIYSLQGFQSRFHLEIYILFPKSWIFHLTAIFFSLTKNLNYSSQCIYKLNLADWFGRRITTGDKKYVQFSGGVNCGVCPKELCNEYNMRHYKVKSYKLLKLCIT